MEHLSFSEEEQITAKALYSPSVTDAIYGLLAYNVTVRIAGQTTGYIPEGLPPEQRVSVYVDYDAAASFGGLETVLEHLRVLFKSADGFMFRYYFDGEREKEPMGRRKAVTEYTETKRDIKELLDTITAPAAQRKLLRELLAELTNKKGPRQ